VGVPADDAVNLSDSQNRLLRLEEKYLKPFLTRRLALGSATGEGGHGGPRYVMRCARIGSACVGVWVFVCVKVWNEGRASAGAGAGVHAVT
jgi:hypothetical protein